MKTVISQLVAIAIITGLVGCGLGPDSDNPGSGYESAADQLISEFNGDAVDPAAVDQVLAISKRLTLEARSGGILKMITALKQDLKARGIDGSVLDEIEDFTLGHTLPGVGEYIEAAQNDGVSSQSYRLRANNPNLEHYECPLMEAEGEKSCVQIVDRIMKQVMYAIDANALHELAKEMIEQDPVVSGQSQAFKDYAQQYLDNIALAIHKFGVEMAAIRAEYTLRDAQLCDNRLIEGPEIARLRGIEEAETIIRKLVNQEGITLAPRGQDCLKVGKAGADTEARIERAINSFLTASEAKEPMCPDLSAVNTSVQEVKRIRREGVDRGVRAHTATIWVITQRNGNETGREQYIVARIDGCNARDQVRDTTSPLVLDLDGDGLELSLDRVRFDLRATGQPQRVTWIGKGEALLAMDLNADGRVTSGRELFGDHSDCRGVRCADGAAALAIHDRPELGGNGDGRIDGADAVYYRLLLWADRNQDGISQAKELRHLCDQGISSLSLRADYFDQPVPAGRISLSLEVHTDTGPRLAYDVWFDNLVDPGFPVPLP